MDDGLRKKAQDFCLIAALVALVPGLGLAVYPSYLERTTGQAVTEKPLQPTGAGKFQPVMLDLDPGMNPIWLEWSAEVDSSRSWQRSAYSVELRLGAQPAWSGPFDIVAKRASQSVGRESGSIATVEVAQAGQYQFVVERTGGIDSAEDIRDLRVAVKRNVRVAPAWCLPVGVGLLAAGFLLGWLGLFVLERKPAAGGPSP